MNKNHGFAASLILAAALVLRPPGSITPSDAQTPATAAGLPIQETAAENHEGPWMASCDYWAPVRPSIPQPARSPEISGTIDTRKIDIHLDLPGSAKQERGCVANSVAGRWGIPDDPAIQVTGLLTIVPDPVHTHLALTFDRTVDAVLQAGGDNGYLPGYFWLPWKSDEGIIKSATAASAMESGHDPDRQRQPGLIILRSADDFNKVVYLFIVGETPTEGIEGAQLQNAFLYESQLEKALGNRFSTGKAVQTKSAVAVIGPTFSGSAASLRAGIDAAGKSSALRRKQFEIAGATYSSIPTKWLNREAPPGVLSSPGISYVSFGYNSDYTIDTFLEHLSRSDYDLSRVALLVEDDTAYASGVIASEKNFEAKRGKHAHLPITIRFPREISSHIYKDLGP